MGLSNSERASGVAGGVGFGIAGSGVLGLSGIGAAVTGAGISFLGWRTSKGTRIGPVGFDWISKRTMVVLEASMRKKSTSIAVALNNRMYWMDPSIWESISEGERVPATFPSENTKAW